MTGTLKQPKHPYKVSDMPSKPHSKHANTANGDADYTQFPAARYFQVHFEHLETELRETRNSLNELILRLIELENRLACNKKPPERVFSAEQCSAKPKQSSKLTTSTDRPL